MEQSSTGTGLPAISEGLPTSPALNTQPEIEALLSRVPPESRHEVRYRLQMIKDNDRTSVRLAIESGCSLLALKAALPHGMFREAYELVGRNKRSAQNDMRVAEIFGKHAELVSHYPVRVINKVSAKSTPDSIRNEIIARAEARNPLPSREIEELITRSKGLAAFLQTGVADPRPRKAAPPRSSGLTDAVDAQSAEFMLDERRSTARRAAELIFDRFEDDLDELAFLLGEADADELLRYLLRLIQGQSRPQ